MRRITLALALALCLPAATASAALRIKPGKLTVVKIGKFKPGQDASLAAATRAFGEPRTRTPDDAVCNATWKDLGLKIAFVNLGAPGEGPCQAGSAQTFTAEGERFATNRGLRVRGSARAVLNAHPNADRHRSSFWLKTARSPFGDNRPFAVLSAQFSGGRVTAFKGYIGAAGE